MPKSLLIANRGEIAVRIARTAEDLGVETVAVYAEDDAASLHTRQAGRAISLGAPGVPAYLDGDNILAVAQFELLAALAEHPRARPGQLARLLNMRPNTVTTIVNALSSRGMLDRATAAGDRRAVELTVTEAGHTAVLAWQATNAAVLHLALSTLPASQRRALAAAVPALDALAGAIDRLADSGHPPAMQADGPADPLAAPG